jgi:hypothetical protein
LASDRRQAALGVFGAVLLAAGFATGGFLTSRSSPEVSKSSAPQLSEAGIRCHAWFTNNPPDRVTAIESGTAALDVLIADEPKNMPIVVVLTGNGKPQGAVEFNAYKENGFLKIVEVVNANCESEERYRNDSRSGDKHILQDYDEVEITFGSFKYLLRLGFDSGAVEASLKRVL